MIFGKNAEQMLKYQKAKAKLVEYHVPVNEYPGFTMNSNELSYPTTYILSRYSECVIEENQRELDELEPFLRLAAQYYDAAFNSEDRKIYDVDFLMSGASAYFLNNDFGSAKVLAEKANTILENNMDSNPQTLLLNIYNYLLDGVPLPFLKGNSIFVEINKYFRDYFEKGQNQEALKRKLFEYRGVIYGAADPDDVFYVDILLAVIFIACRNSSWELLPRCSDIIMEDWTSYLYKTSSIKMLWPAQRLIAEKGILRGENAIVQLPTGVGKTKSIELIIRAAFLSHRAHTAIIVAPLRALCNEITMDMHRSFSKEVTINQFSDVLQNDFSNLFSDNDQKQILICTPEKLSYILHHDTNFLNLIDLFIFDEGHMFDDGSRGVAYELLVTHIRQHLSNKQQFVLLSAVLSNSEKIQKWLFADNGVLASDPKIVSTPKSVGFTSNQKNIYFFTDDKSEEDYFIPRVIKIQKLKNLPRERKEHLFPDLSSRALSSSIDVAIYNALKLCSNGGVAIYIAQQRSMKTVFERLLDLNKREYDLDDLKNNSDALELEKIKSFIEQYYGTDHYYTKAAQLGVLPHSSNIQNGVKLVAEYAIKKKHVACVVCTSTLAQGVNIPIKYLLVTSMRVGQKIMKVRNFQNLIGRTARSGIYTEGSIIITDTKIYDERRNWKGKHTWNECIKMFDPQSAEPCSSSILSLVQDMEIDYEYAVRGKKFIEAVINHLDGKEYLEEYAKKLVEVYLKEKPDGTQSIVKQVHWRQEILDCIENYLCLVYSDQNIDKDKESMAMDICINTLAFALATDEEKELLQKVFLKISGVVQKYPTVKLRNYANAMSGIEQSLKIEQWIIANELVENYFSEEELLDMIIEFYLELNDDMRYRDQFQDVCQAWVKGKLPYEISAEKELDISEIDDLCSKRISYELNFLIGNICDLIVIDEENDEQVDPRNTLMILQEKVKYGVPNITAVSICEKIFNDRLLALKLTEILDDENIPPDRIVRRLKRKQEAIFSVLEEYPVFFCDRLKFALR